MSMMSLKNAVLFGALLVFFYQLTFFCLKKYGVDAAPDDLYLFSVSASILTAYVWDRLARKWKLE